MNKTGDGRIIDKRVVIDKKLLGGIVYSVKIKNKLNWKDIAEELGVCKQTIRNDWLKKGNTIPLCAFKKLLDMSDQKFKSFEDKITIKEPFWGQSLEKAIKKVKLPDHEGKQFAELYGILLGDGCVFSNGYGFAVSGDKILDREYLNNYVGKLILKLFGVKPSYYYGKKVRSLNCIVYSKTIASYLVDIGFPPGEKAKGNLVIPKFIFKDNALLSRCIRGIMDTDGSLSAHPNVKIMIHLSIPHKPLRDSVLRAFRQLNMKVGFFNKGIMIYGTDKIREFREKIGFSNLKNNLKYDIFVNTGRVPTSKEVEMFIRKDYGV